MVKKIATAVLPTLAVAGCAGTGPHPLASTVTVTAPATVTVTVTESAASAPGGSTPSPSTEPATPVAFQYGPNGAYAVGEAREGLTQVIAPGRYRVEGVSGSGFLKQCDSVICDMTGTEHVVDTTITQSGVPTILDIPASASVVAVYLFDTTANPLE